MYRAHYRITLSPWDSLNYTAVRAECQLSFLLALSSAHVRRSRYHIWTIRAAVMIGREKNQVDRNGMDARCGGSSRASTCVASLEKPSSPPRKSPPVAVITFSKGRHGSSDNIYRPIDLSARSTIRWSIDSGYRSLALSLSLGREYPRSDGFYEPSVSGFLGGEPFEVGRGQGLAPGRIYSWTVKNNV